MKNFIKIRDTRLRKSTIKKYAPSGELSIIIFYGTSRYKVESEVFKFTTNLNRNIELDLLDQNL